MSNFKTPGVYIREKDSFTSSVVAVPTAVPAFIGYTSKALRGKTSLTNVPTKVTSLAEYVEMFGEGPKTTFTVKMNEDGTITATPDENTHFYMFNCIRLFYANGGGDAYIVSVGDYDYKKGVDPSDLNSPGKGLDTLVKEQEPTMVLSPDALLADEDDCYSLFQDIIGHCGARMKSRIGIFDVYAGHSERHNDTPTVETFRNKIGNNNLAFGCVYYPWLNTTIVSANEIDYRRVSNREDLISYLNDEATSRVFGNQEVPAAAEDPNAANLAKAQALIASINEKNVDDVMKELAKLNKGFSKGKETDIAKLKDSLNAKAASVFQTKANDDPRVDKLNAIKAEIAKLASDSNAASVGQTVSAISGLYKEILKVMREELNVLPPASAMAGVMAAVDNAEGVHKAPANLSLNSVVSPTINLTNETQEDLNLPLNGKAVNAIRSFVGKGVLVWGARTLDGNSQDWRYINVRRAMIMIQQSIKNSVESYVFEPNTSKTWVKVKASIDNFLSDLWRAGTLAGGSPSAAFEVNVGLGNTMTPVDILDGVMRISVKVAITRPAEFIEITFEQKMQES